MRARTQVYDNPVEAAAVGRRGRHTMVSSYSVQRVGALVEFHAKRITALLASGDARADAALRHVPYSAGNSPS